VTPEHWASLTDTNIAKAEEQCKASATLRGVIDSILNQCSQDVETQRAKVDLAFEKRAQEIADAKKTLEQHLAKVCGGSIHAHEKSCGAHESDYRTAGGQARNH
jgi:predicted aconitase